MIAAKFSHSIWEASVEGAAQSGIVGGNLYLCLPACNMALKAKGVPEGQYQICCALAERTVRLASQGESGFAARIVLYI